MQSSHRAFFPGMAAVVLAAMFAAAGPVLAWPGGPAGGYGSDWNDRDTRGSNGPREGQVTVDRFLAPDAKPPLMQRANAVITAPDEVGDAREDATFAAAVVDQLAKAGYDTVTPDAHGGLVTQVRHGRTIVVPEEPRHRPVGGEMDAGVSNHGSGLGLGLFIDLTKPKKALIDTRLEVRIIDRLTGKAAWEGRADIITREGDRHWPDGAVAARLAGALFAHFPGPHP